MVHLTFKICIILRQIRTPDKNMGKYVCGMRTREVW